jgi:Domain of unknown function (DUF4440)
MPLLLAAVAAALISPPNQQSIADDDEQELRDIQQQLARAWIEKDRAFIEQVLAPEWKVTQTDGSILTRADVLRNAFENSTLIVKSSKVDDVTVTFVGTTAIVRGRTEATGIVNGKSISARLRFTDVFVKRDGRWQAIASHASSLAQ